MRAWVFITLAIAGLSQAAIKVNLDPPKVEYAKPWTKGVNMCAYIARPGLLKYSVFSYCLPWKQDYCGIKSSFTYDCCPGFKRTSRFDNKCVERERTWKTIPDLLKIRDHAEYAKLLTSSKQGAGFQQLANGKDGSTYTVFAPYSDSVISKSEIKMNSFNGRKNHPVLANVVKGRVYTSDLRNGMKLKSEYKGQELKVTKYSNGILCVECREFVEPDHEAKNGVFHYIAGLMGPHSGAGNSRGNLMELLRSDSRTSKFAAALPQNVQKILSNPNTAQWYTVFAPTDSAWQNTAAKYPKNLQEIAATHVVKQMYCSAALIGNNQNLGGSESGEPLFVTCGKNGKRRVTTRFGPEATVITPDLMAPNGVAHIVDNVLVPSKAMSLKSIVASPMLKRYIGSSLWPKTLKECDLRMKDGNSYAVMIPNQRAFDWWEKYDRFKKYYNRFLIDKAFRCRLARFHVGTMASNRDSTLPYLWLQQVGYRTTNPDKLWEVDYFLKRDYGSQLYYHYSPVYPFNSVQFDRGSIYYIDRVNMIPEKRLVNVLADTPYLKTMSQKTNQMKMDQKVFRKNEPLNLYLAIRNNGWTGNSRNAKEGRKYRNTNLYNFLLLHWVNNWLWGGDIGYFEPRSRHRFMSGVGLELIFDRNADGTMYIGYEKLPRNLWSKVVEWNLFAIDGNIWVLDRPLICPKKYCGKTKILEKEIWKVLSFACWESLRAAPGAKGSQLEPWLDSVEGNQCFTNRETPKKESSEHSGK